MHSAGNEQFVPGFSLALRFALREMRAGLRGFYIFLGCIALGVAAISGVGSVAKSITQGISTQGQSILGADIAFSLVQREFTPEQIEFFKGKGEIAQIVTMRTMARKLDGSDQGLVELKVVDNAYPLYGNLELQDLDFGPLAPDEAYVGPVLLDRLGIKVGDGIRVGNSEFRLKDTIASEPDKVAEGLDFGPRLIVSRQGLENSGLIQPGSLLRYHVRLKIDNPSLDRIKAIADEANEKFPDMGWRVRSSANAAPALSRSVDRFSQFLTLVGLTSLIVGGVGVANASRAFLETKRQVIATFKSLGAPGGMVFNLYLSQIMIMATIGIALGLAIGVAMPYAARGALGEILPVSQGSLFFPSALLPGILFGFLTSLIFAIWPLALSRDVQPTDLFRASSYGGKKQTPRLFYRIVLYGLVILLIASAVYFSENRFIASVFAVSIGVSFVLLQSVAVGIQWLAKRAPSSRSPALRMAVANIHRPGSLTSSVILSLGLGLALLVALASIDANLRSQVSNTLSEDAPDFFFLDIQNHEIDSFRDRIAQLSPEGKVIAVPMLRGRVVELKGIPSTEYTDVQPGGAWVLRGDRGITYAKNVPENSTLSQGEWWPADYSGEPLVSVAAEEAYELNLNIGDKITVNVLGRNISAKIANFRQVQWESMGINFVFVFSPNTFAGAPHSFLATLTSPKRDKIDISSNVLDTEETRNADAVLLRDLANTFPSVTAVRIRDTLATVNNLIDQLSNAIRAAASVALISSILVLAGALAAGNRERVHDAVILKTLGATRRTLMKMLVLEYAILGLATAIFAILAGSLAAWFVVSVIMDFIFVVKPGIAMGTIVTALAFTIVLGLFGTWRILGQKAAPILREL